MIHEDVRRQWLVHALRALASRIEAGAVSFNDSDVAVSCLDAPPIEIQSLTRGLSDREWREPEQHSGGALVRQVSGDLLTMRVHVIAPAASYRSVARR